MNLTSCQQNSLNVLKEWFYSGKTTATLVGAAGTGKTFLSKYFLDLVKPTCTVSAPTHKARFVIQRTTGRKSETIQSILGLRPEFNIDHFDINNPSFTLAGKVKIQGELLLIDEASMLNKDLLKYLKQLSQDFDFKILFIGDKLQLPPIGESISSAFKNVDVITELKTLVRQSATNPLMLMLLALRLDIANLCQEEEKESIDALIELSDQKIIDLSVSEIENNKGQLFKLLLKKGTCNIKDGQGINLVRNPQEFVSEIYREFNADSEGTRLLAFTNDAVTKWNSYIRNQIVNTNQDEYIAKGDILMGYMNNGCIYNGCDYVVRDAEPCLFENVPVYKTKLNEVGTDYNHEIYMVRYTDDDEYMSFQSAHEANHKNARLMRGLQWQNYYDWRKQYSVPVSMNKEEYIHPELMIEPNHLPKKDVDYGYAITVHKSQGSTFNNVLIDGEDLVKCLKMDKTMFFKLMYVAASRAKDRCHIYFPK